MNPQHYFLVPVAILLAVTMFVGGLSAGADPPAGQWQYNTTQVTHDQLTETLKQMGDDGWEVFSIQDTRSVIENDPANNQPHVRTEMFQVTAKRSAR